MEDLTLLAVAELEGEVDSPTALDYVEHWLTNGQTMIALAAKLQADSKLSGLGEYSPILEGGGLARMLRRRFDPATVDEVLVRARARGSAALVESTHVIADEVVTSSEDAARARNRIGTRQWAAERFDRGTFGQQRGPMVAVQINMGQLHIDAMRKRNVPAQNVVEHIGTPEITVLLDDQSVTDADVLVEQDDQLTLLPSTT